MTSDTEALKALEEDVQKLVEQELFTDTYTLLPHPRFSDDLPQVVNIGDEGQWWIMFGHWPIELAAAAFALGLIDLVGVNEFYQWYESIDQIAKETKHTYVVERIWREGDDNVPEVSEGDPYILVNYKLYPEEEWIKVTLWNTY